MLTLFLTLGNHVLPQALAHDSRAPCPLPTAEPL